MHQTWSSFSYSARDQTLVVNLVLIFLLTDLTCHANQFLYPFPKCLLHFALTEKPDAPAYSHLQLSVGLGVDFCQSQASNLIEPGSNHVANVECLCVPAQNLSKNKRKSD